ncbi:MAG: hypothetical protein V4574_12185 [Pseudomonadota bacterium]
MRTRWIAGLCAMIALAAPAQAQVALEPGQGVTVHIGNDDVAKTGAIGPAALAAHDQVFLRQLPGAYASGQELVFSSVQDAPPMAPDALTLRFIVIDGKSTMLALENGYDDAIRYRARITVRGKSQPTDVCLVIPGKRGYEHWPYAIERIELGEFTHFAWKDGDPLPCE